MHALALSSAVKVPSLAGPARRSIRQSPTNARRALVSVRAEQDQKTEGESTVFYAGNTYASEQEVRL